MSSHPIGAPWPNPPPPGEALPDLHSRQSSHYGPMQHQTSAPIPGPPMLQPPGPYYQTQSNSHTLPTPPSATNTQMSPLQPYHRAPSHSLQHQQRSPPLSMHPPAHAISHSHLNLPALNSALVSPSSQLDREHLMRDHRDAMLHDARREDRVRQEHSSGHSRDTSQSHLPNISHFQPSQQVPQPQLHSQNQPKAGLSYPTQELRPLSQPPPLLPAHSQGQQSSRPHEPVLSPRQSIPLQQPIASRVPSTLHGPNGILNEHRASSPGPSNSAQVAGNESAVREPERTHAIDDSDTHYQNNPTYDNMSNGQPLVNLTDVAAPAQRTSRNAGGQTQTQGQQPILNDALSYLDQVKVRFQDRPDVYNRFLDIMKDFKSQAIDTPGVIDRVSTLFAGHPELIQGFNTFLPPGYKIECGLNDDPNSIRVTTPMGTTVQQMSTVQGRLAASINGANVREGKNHIYIETGQNADWAAQHDQEHKHRNQHQQHENDINEGHYAASRQAALGLFAGQPHVGTDGMARSDDRLNVDAQGHLVPEYGSDQQILGLEKRGPVEFNHAIGYVNKIKNRFAAQPEIYKQFLEILQTYQRESKPIQDVYAQVTQLFSSAQDLLEDFKQFLPESAAQAKAQAQAHASSKQNIEEASMLNIIRGSEAFQIHGHGHSSTPRPDSQKMPPMGTFAPPSASKDNKKRKGGAGSQMTGGAASASILSQENMNGGAGGTAVLNGKGRGAANSANKRAKIDPAKSIAHGLAPISPTLVPSLPVPLPPSKDNTITNEEFAFFERVKKHLANRPMFNDFLKVLNLFTQEIIDKATVIQRVHGFIGGNPELMSWFKNFMAYSGDDVRIVNEARIPAGKVMLSNCRGLGPSYRLLPNRERLRPCAGRDEICKSVLNDAWVSHPTWASEESGFIAHRKNLYEEALHRIEEERHDYDINVEACLRTIQLLEPIAQQMLMMTDEEKFAFKLPPGIGGQSETIYQRVIKKIYGREKGCLVVRDMFERPSAVVPILLGRLKQKAEEWKASQREWEKVWREQTNRIFWRSLDHQGIGQKQSDKRQFQPKTLHTEIQTIYDEQRRRRALGLADTARHQLKYDFDDTEILLDASRLVLCQLHHHFVGSDLDRTRLDLFLKTFIPTFFDIDRDSFEERMRDVYTSASSDNDDGENVEKLNDQNIDEERQSQSETMNCDTIKPKSDNEDQVTSNPAADGPETSKTSAKVETESGTPPSDSSEHQWLSFPGSGQNATDLNKLFDRDDFHLYATSNIYCFFRMFQALYERLGNLKSLESRVHEDVARGSMPKPAVDLGLVDKVPAEFFSDISPTANYYRQVVHMCEEVVRQNHELPHLEETLRRFYMPDGWQLYSLDKLLGAMLRFAMQILVSDSKDKSLDIINLFYKDRKDDQTTHQNELTYRKQVEKLARDSDVFRIRFNRSSKTAFVQIFKKDDKTYEADELAATARWSYYVSAYSMFDRTEGISLSTLRSPYLRRNMPEFISTMHDKDDEDIANNRQQRLYYSLNHASLNDATQDGEFVLPLANHDGLIIRISPNNYHILYDPGTRDWWVQAPAMQRRGLGGYAEIKAERTAKARAIFNEKDRNPWMRALMEADSADGDAAIAKIIGEYDSWISDGPSKIQE